MDLRTANPAVLTDDLIAANNLNPVKGVKRGFCVIDFAKAPNFQGQRDPQKYVDCGYGTTVHGNQGIGVGWADTYGSKLEGQWIDVTDVPDGDYVLEVEANAQHSFQEVNYNDDFASKQVKVIH